MSSPTNQCTTHACSPTLAALDELKLLKLDHEGTQYSHTEHELRTAPILTPDALSNADLTHDDIQYGVFGELLSVIDKETEETPSDPRLYLNTNAPFSAIVCGVQGSGKSHTVATILESMFIQDPRIGSLRQPLCGLVFHMSDGGLESIPSEAAWLAVSNSPYTETPNVHVYVSPSSIRTMRAVYAPLGKAVVVRPLRFTEDELDAEAFLMMMSVGSSEAAPLYMQIFLSILRDLGENYSFAKFMRKLEEKKQDFNTAQLTGLKQRMALLETFVDRTGSMTFLPPSRFVAGQVTIVDLSDPFIDSSAACGIFQVVARLFVRSKVDTGKVLVVDEAHKYLSASEGLTVSLLTLIREQRHKAMRVIISTQEPSVVPSTLISLCSVAILHRFSSPSWCEHIAKHVSADLSTTSAFERVVTLHTGEAVMLAPSGIQMQSPSGTPTSQSGRTLGQFGRRYLHVRARQRITRDGGGSRTVL
ncbi:hypothetical protein BD410DRAFT_731134 [Rickenella mellea]|uniref:Zona occludens toxin N-terminal domain-containing protein n=1 Tax=Rickenella mellea TaxID=50990 RepID=A0A4Y7PQ51_9AGAM|nr:hypothetical protein BD410DRAFT_731134 [Rickenella mellea]